jgi:hypothetical protein
MAYEPAPTVGRDGSGTPLSVTLFTPGGERTVKAHYGGIRFVLGTLLYLVMFVEDEAQ